jgi:hypothetical protein
MNRLKRFIIVYTKSKAQIKKVVITTTYCLPKLMGGRGLPRPILGVIMKRVYGGAK